MSAIIPAGTWTIDPAHSQIGFTIRHLAISKVKGHFGDFSGTIVSDGTTEGTQVTAEIQVASIDTKVADRDAHLRSGDFFDAEAFPTITFSSTSVTPNGDEFVLTGDLTVRGVTKPITIAVEPGGVAGDLYGRTIAAAEATTTIVREDFGLTYNATLETGGLLLGPDVAVHIEIEAAAAAE